MPRQPSSIFTDKELEIMRVVWDLGEATVRQIQENLPGDDRRHYNSVLTIVRVLEQKGHLTYRVEGKAHVYRAVEQQEKARRGVLAHLIDNVFGGSPTSLVLNLVETGELSRKDLDQIRQLLDEAKSKEEKR